MIFVFVFLSSAISLAEVNHATWNPTEKERSKIAWLPLKRENVLIGFESIAMPLGRIILIRKGQKYCAIKFIDTWLGETEWDHFSSYEYYYQGDGSGDFSKGNIISGTGELYFPRIRPFLNMLGYQKGRNTTIKCGGMKFEWIFIASLYLSKTYELAPTPWMNINEVNDQDPRIKWYKKDSHRKKLEVPIDQLWDDAKK